jgi:hypothetical protein
VVLADGSGVVDTDAGGRAVFSTPDGRTVESLEEGWIRTVFPDGTIVLKHEVREESKQTNLDGSVIEKFPDGRVKQTDTSGVVLERLSDGSQIQRDFAGLVIETRPDGSSFFESGRFVFNLVAISKLHLIALTQLLIM